jgi:hypothetical protein
VSLSSFLLFAWWPPLLFLVRILSYKRRELVGRMAGQRAGDQPAGGFAWEIRQAGLHFGPTLRRPTKIVYTRVSRRTVLTPRSFPTRGCFRPYLIRIYFATERTKRPSRVDPVAPPLTARGAIHADRISGESQRKSGACRVGSHPAVVFTQTFLTEREQEHPRCILTLCFIGMLNNVS